MSANHQVSTSTGKVLPFNPSELALEKLVDKALTEPGFVSKAFTTFYGYSLNNRLSALWQCMVRGIEPGPLASYRAWQALDRQVRQGEKAILILHPIYHKETDEKGVERTVLTGFTYKPSAFVLAQTDGEELELAAEVPFDLEAVLTELHITAVPFEEMDGNVLGYATSKRQVSVSPVAPDPARVLFHEIGHVVLGHVEKNAAVDYERFGRSTQEVEAELFSYLVTEMLGIDAANEKARAESRGYIQHWRAASNEWSEKNSRRVLSAVDRFLGLTKKSPSTSIPAEQAN